MKISIITRCTRQHNLKTVKESIFNNIPKGVKIDWHIIFDVNALKDIDAEMLGNLKDKNTIFHFERGDNQGMLYPQSSKLIESFKNCWVYFLDDDNLMHPNFYKIINENVKNNPDKFIHVVSQFVDGKDFSGLKIRLADPKSVKKGHIDLAQYIVHSNVYNTFNYKFKPDYCADGILIEQIFNENPNWFAFIIDELCYYNALQKKSIANVPKILYIGDTEPELKSFKMLNYEADNLNVKYLKNDNNVHKEIIEFNPDCIITRGENWESFQSMSVLPMQFRRKWINISNMENDEVVGNIAYNVSMQIMLDPDSLEDSNLISYTTPIYNTGQKLYNTYESLKQQTYQNWEWILINDSSDGGRTLKIAEDIASNDPRVKVYDFREKSKGNIGEVKWRANCMAKGFILAELDHDDLLVPWCTEDLYKAAKKHPEVGFFFNDTLELDENWNYLTYPEGFALGYGKYRDEMYNGKMVKVATQHNINPKTIRHIVGVPNHVRAWRRSTYFEIGGHNRNLAIADDYELIVRTFLKTITCKIPKLGYIQFLYNNQSGQNTHDLARADIQRRVRTIADYYNKQISERFTELGLNDWAFNENPNQPLYVESKYGDEEMPANIIYKENE